MIYLDFETRSVADLIKWGQMRYATDPTTQALCMCWSYDEEEEIHLWHRAHEWIDEAEFPEELCERIASGEIVEAHNAGFEFNIFNISLRREFPRFRPYKISLEQLRCSAAKASCLSLPRSLGEACEALNLPHQKDADGKRLINKLSKPMPRRKGSTEIRFCEEEIEHRRNWAYCQQDVRSERALSEYCPEMSERELDYWRMDFRMNQRGIALDADGAKAALEMAGLEGERLNSELQEITGDPEMKGSKRKAYMAWANGRLQEIGAKTLPDTKADTLSFALYGVPTKAGDETRAANKPQMDIFWEGLGEEGAKVRRSMEICMEVNRSSVSKYKRMLDSVCPDGRLHDIMLYNGADRTGRWSGKGVQPHNFVRGYSKDMNSAWIDIQAMDREQITLIWEEPMVALAKACRGALTASPGKTLYAADFNAIEARKLAWLSNCTRLLTLFSTKGGDPYCDMASAIYKRPITKADKTERNLGKKAILGLGYAMGWEKFQLTVWMDEGIWLEDEFCQEVVRLYRKEMYPEIPMLWKDAGNAAIRAVTDGGQQWCGGDEAGVGAVCYYMSEDGNFLHCELPSGRRLAYLYPEVHTRVTYRFKALNRQGKPTTVSFPAKKKVPQSRVRYHAEKLAEKQGKRLIGEAPESFLSPHLSFMGRDIYTKKWKRVGTHGGSLVENFDQASSRDLLAEAMYRIDSRDEFDLLLSIHDEVIAEGAKGACTLEEYEALMAQVPDWAPGMPIAAEGWIGERLRK